MTQSPIPNPQSPIPFPTYLAAKTTVDDRALNRHVWESLRASLPKADAPLRVLEIGGGIGTMLERVMAWGLFDGRTGPIHYTILDADPVNTATAQARLGAADLPVNLAIVTADALGYANQVENQGRFDLLIAHAFLDLLDLPTALPRLVGLLRPGGLIYATINFDGMTLFEPTLDPILDQQIEDLYHASMDARVTDGKPSGDSRTGRHLFGHLRIARVDVLAAGSSDWVVHAMPNGSYPAEEATFLRAILGFFAESLGDHPALDGGQLRDWLQKRHDQIDRGELVYIAHQLDFLGGRAMSKE
ncbi:MAG: class I SAM-dependent methyltransferase [Caldilineaceae bacterium]|nr:class I SAM-dependent methyltransferase [Caldilineaceae bacterium]MBP8124421.1 class I SAM-dependent methyltransferase [Caldilineaceae bacterium]MBP9072210.1 class I SAM-dependent methyltransferase [Caldilineaceae bacterium]